MSPSDERVQQLIGLTERLTGLLTAETAAFEARRPHEVAAQSAETARLANIYRHETARIKSDPALVKSAAPAARARLVEATRRFEAVLDRHGRSLAAAKRITEGLVQAIAEEVAATRDARSPYRANARTPSANASAIALNRRA